MSLHRDELQTNAALREVPGALELLTEQVSGLDGRIETLTDTLDEGLGALNSTLEETNSLIDRLVTLAEEETSKDG